jgi:hypothetical protein
VRRIQYCAGRRIQCCEPEAGRWALVCIFYSFVANHWVFDLLCGVQFQVGLWGLLLMLRALLCVFTVGVARAALCVVAGVLTCFFCVECAMLALLVRLLFIWC